MDAPTPMDVLLQAYAAARTPVFLRFAGADGGPDCDHGNAYGYGPCVLAVVRHVVNPRDDDPWQVLTYEAQSIACDSEGRDRVVTLAFPAASVTVVSPTGWHQIHFRELLGWAKAFESVALDRGPRG